MYRKSGPQGVFVSINTTVYIRHKNSLFSIEILARQKMISVSKKEAVRNIRIDKRPPYIRYKNTYSVSKILLYQKRLFSIEKDSVSQSYFQYQKIVSVSIIDNVSKNANVAYVIVHNRAASIDVGRCGQD